MFGVLSVWQELEACSVRQNNRPADHDQTSQAVPGQHEAPFAEAIAPLTDAIAPWMMSSLVRVMRSRLNLVFLFCYFQLAVKQCSPLFQCMAR